MHASSVGTQPALAWAGSFFGLAGAGVLSINTGFSGWGWAFFLASNACLIPYLLQTRQRHMLLMQIGFTLTSLTGIVRWLVP